MTAPRLALLASLATLAGCGRIGGSGVAAESVRSVPAFSQVTVEHFLEADVTIGGASRVVVSGDDNLVPLVVTTVVDGQLVIGVQGDRDLAPVQPLRVQVDAPALAAIAASGFGTLHASGLAGDALTIGSSGGGDVTAAGACHALTVDVNGGAALDAGALTAATASVHVDANAHATITATEAVTGSVGANSSLHVLGNPPARSVDVAPHSELSFE